MTLPAFKTMLSLLERVKTTYENESSIYRMDLSLLERVKQEAPIAKEDRAFIYSEVEKFIILLPSISAEIEKYQNNNSWFKSKKEINVFLASLSDYAYFFQLRMKALTTAIKELDKTETSARESTAVASTFLELEQLSKGNKITTKRNKAVKILAYVVIQKKSLLCVFKSSGDCL